MLLLYSCVDGNIYIYIYIERERERERESERAVVIFGLFWSEESYLKITNLVVASVFQKFSSVYGTRRSVNFFTEPRRLVLMWIREIQSKTLNRRSFRPTLILSFHTHVSLWVSLITFTFSRWNPAHISSRFHACYKLCPSHSHSSRNWNRCVHKNLH